MTNKVSLPYVADIIMCSLTCSSAREVEETDHCSVVDLAVADKVLDHPYESYNIIFYNGITFSQQAMPLK
jgi:hypothetical protein